jgi:hypothetical protein
MATLDLRRGRAEIGMVDSEQERILVKSCHQCARSPAHMPGVIGTFVGIFVGTNGWKLALLSKACVL